MIDAAIRRTESGEDLSIEEVVETFEQIISGRCAEDDIARWLLALNRKGPSVSEVAGAALALRRKMTPIRSSRSDLLDTCGTGGDRLNTFNISTAAALVTAAAGVPVAKHGNRAASSRSGSADVLAVLGVDVEAGVPRVERCLDELGICFCFAPLLHEAMRHVGPVRKKLGVPTIFNILGPLINPASAARQLLGVGRPELRVHLAQALLVLGTERTVVVHGSDGLDEVTLSGSTEVAEAISNRTHRASRDVTLQAEREAYGQLRQFRWTPADFCLNAVALKSIQVTSAEESAALIRAVLAGEPGPARDIVIANAAAALWTAGKGPSPAACAALAAAAIDSGAARDLLARLVALSSGK
jgi:anthranilate phosphoribosyltransferase